MTGADIFELRTIEEIAKKIMRKSLVETPKVDLLLTIRVRRSHLVPELVEP